MTNKNKKEQSNCGSIKISSNELTLISQALTLALTCANDMEYLTENNSEVRKVLKDQVLVLDEKIKCLNNR